MTESTALTTTGTPAAAVQPRGVAAPLLAIGGVLGALALPLLLITLSVRLVIFTPWLYEYGFARYNIPAVTGIERAELLRAADETRRYFAGNYEPLAITVQRFGADFTLYNEREVAHMADVKAMVQGVERVQYGALAVLLLLLGAGLSAQSRGYLRSYGGVLLWGGGLTFALVVLAGLGAALFFEALFLQFHLISFSNDLWILDPSRDFLIMMYPGGFFQDATLLIGGLALALALLTMVVGAVLRRRPGQALLAAATEGVMGPAANPEVVGLLREIDADLEGIVRWFDTVLYPESVPVGEWHAKDVLGHLVYWHRSSANAVTSVAEGQGPTTQTDTVDALNAQVRLATRSIQVRELTVALSLSHRKLSAAARRVNAPEAVVRVRLDGSERRLAELLRVTRDHLRQHLAELREASIRGHGG